MTALYTFLRSMPGRPDHAADPTMALMAICVAEQQRAGFGTTIDLRHFECPSCRGAGFNSGWGFFRFTCGAEILTGDDGDITNPCGKAEVAA